jgi:hypothetical protein
MRFLLYFNFMQKVQETLKIVLTDHITESFLKVKHAVLDI